MRGQSSYEDHMCHKMDEGSGEICPDVVCLSSDSYYDTQQRYGGESSEQSASVIMICNHVTL